MRKADSKAGGYMAPLAGAAGVVLAGGSSRRMGATKAALDIGGEPLLRRVVRRLEEAMARVVVVGSEEMAALVPGIEVWQDRRPGMGPLGGVETALLAAREEHVFVVACDMPFVAPALARAMVEMAAGDTTMDVVALRTARGLEFLHAVYSQACLPVIQGQLDAGDLAMRHLLARLRVREIDASEAVAFDPDGFSAFNANTPAEWRRALDIVQIPQP